VPQRRPRLSLEALEDRYVLSTLTVTSNADDIMQQGTLRYAIDHAGSRDTIRIAPALHNTPIVLTQELLITKDLTIQATEDAPATISGPPISPDFYGSGVFEIARNADVTLSYLTITRGTAVPSGGGIYNLGELTLTNCTVSGNLAGSGAGIFNDSGTVALNSSTVFGNLAGSGNGGGIYNKLGTVTLNHSSVSNNHTNPAGFGGGIFNENGTVTITKSTVSDNGYGDLAGGIYSTGELRLNNSTVSGNSADVGGGIVTSGQATITNCTVSGNSAIGPGLGLK
jgi:hypothetical protein